MHQDSKYLQVLSIFHYVLGGLVAVFTLTRGLHLWGWGKMAGRLGPMPHHWGPMMHLPMAFPAVYVVASAALAIALMFAGYALSKRLHYRFCLVIAAIACLWMPLGTILGIFTIVVLMRDSVQALFAQNHHSPSGE